MLVRCLLPSRPSRYRFLWGLIHCLLAFGWFTGEVGLEPACGQTGQRGVSRTRSASNGVSPDLLSIYQRTKSDQTEESVTSIARACSEIVSDASRRKVDREYASSLFAWALNRRGEMRSERAARLVEDGDFKAADRLDTQAAEDFRTAIEYGPPNWRFHHNYAIALAMKGEYPTAIGEFGRAIELRPEYANAYFNRAEILFELGEFSKAIDDYDQAIAINAADPQYYNSRGHSHFMLENFELAVKDYRQASEIDSSNAVFLTDLADAYQFLGRWKLAAAAYRQAVAADEQYARSYQNAAWLMATCPKAEIRDAQLAWTAAEKALELDGRDTPRGLDTLAAAHANRGEFEEAVKLARRAVDLCQDGGEMAELKQRLRLYVQRRPFRQKAILSVARHSGSEANPARLQTASGASQPRR